MIGVKSLLKEILPASWVHQIRVRRWRRSRHEAELYFLESAFFSQRKLGIAIDVGANYGEFCEVLLRYFDRVLAFEPNPFCFSFLKRVFKQSHFKLELLGLGNSSRILSLSVPIENGIRLDGRGSVSKLNPVKTDGGEVLEFSVSQVCLDDYLAKLGDTRSVDYIKIDTEGFEWDVLQGARDTISKHRPLVQVEVETRHSPYSEDVFGFFEALGYFAYYLGDGDQLFRVSAEEMIAAQDEFGGFSKLAPRGYIHNILFFPDDEQSFMSV